MSGAEERMFSQQQSGEIVQRLIEVIGDEAEAMRWMGTPIHALDYATPISLLHDAKGCKTVRAILGRLEHGIL